MRRIVIFGNSGAGKSTLAGRIAADEGIAHLDLDTLAWQPDSPSPERRPVADSAEEIGRFMRTHASWVIEGCYSDLLGLVLPGATETIFLNPGVEICIRNCRQRPWEPHKYSSPAAQERNLDMLIEWVRAYESRTDEFSLRSHRRLFETHGGPKTEITRQ